MSSIKKYAVSRKHLLFDIFVRVALSVVFAFAAANYLRNGYLALEKVDFTDIKLQQIGYAASVILIGLNAFMIASLYALRLPPIAHYAGILPAAAAILGGFLMAGLFFFTPREDLPFWVQCLSIVLCVAGNFFALVIIFFLGRSFSILPEGRRLIMHGPYAVVRHPLYAAEAVATAGMVVAFFSVWALALLIAQYALQLTRIHFEERILKDTFPEYKAYAARTWRLIPYVY